MNSPPPRTARENGFWPRLSRALGGPRGLTWRDYWVIGMALFLLLSIGVIRQAPDLDDEPGPGWPALETLPEADPVWTESVDGLRGTDSIAIHNDVLARTQDTELGFQVVANDLASGKELMSTESGQSLAWLSGDHLVTMDDPTGEEAVVHDLHTGKKQRTIEFAGLTNTTVTSNAVISVERVNNTDSRLRAVEVSTGKDLWTKDLDKRWVEWSITAPGRTVVDDPFSRTGVTPESTSPVVLLGEDNTSSRGMWDSVHAIDVETGEKRWASPIDYGDFSDPSDAGFQLTDGDDIHTLVKDIGTEKSKSYVIDAKTGKADSYPVPPWGSIPDRNVSLLCGDKLLTTGSGGDAIVDIKSGKTVWRSKDPASMVVNGGDVVFTNVTHEPEEPGADEVEGVRAYDTGSGKELWTRQGDMDMGITVLDDDILATGFADSDDAEPGPSQVFNARTGKGKWQFDDYELAAHNADYLVFMARGEDVSAELSIISRTNPR